MSKAFTKEDAGPPEVLRRPRPSGPRYLTPEGREALDTELRRLGEARAGLAASSALDARTQLAELDARAEELRELLESAEVVPPRPEGEERAYLGAWVELEDDDGETVTYRLVGPDEADARAGRVSVESPLGRALLGREAGDVVGVERPRGRAEFTVAAVRYRPPEDA